MNVHEAVARRMSVRAFLDRPMPTGAIRRLLVAAARAPSGGNLQPWRIAVLNGGRMAEFRILMERRLAGEPYPGGEPPEYPVYPPNLFEPYRSRRFAVGEEMYALLGIPREDRPARLKWFANNFRFFGAPAAIFCFVDRRMGAAQWSDLGMFLQTFMLLAQEAGIDTCPQECWSQYPKTVREFCGMLEDLMLFCGVAVGHHDPAVPVNRLKSSRADPSEWLKVV